MPDGQDKSDDLIAELAKLMANNAQGAEPEAKSAPKLVTLADATKPEGQGPAMVRIPGMDAPVAATPTPAPVVSAHQCRRRPIGPRRSPRGCCGFPAWINPSPPRRRLS